MSSPHRLKLDLHLGVDQDDLDWRLSTPERVQSSADVHDGFPEGVAELRECGAGLTFHQADLPDGRRGRALLGIEVDLLQGDNLIRRTRAALDTHDRAQTWSSA